MQIELLRCTFLGYIVREKFITFLANTNTLLLCTTKSLIEGVYHTIKVILVPQLYKTQLLTLLCPYLLSAIASEEAENKDKSSECREWD